MNDVQERSHLTYKAMWGEKESFWIGMEGIQERYFFVRFEGRVIGNLGDTVPYKVNEYSYLKNKGISRSEGRG